MSERFYDFDVLEAPQAIQEEVYQRVKTLVVSDFPTDTTVFEKLAAWYPPTVGRVRVELSGTYRTVWDNCDMPVPVLTHFESVSDAVRLKDGRLAANTVGGWHVTPEAVDLGGARWTTRYAHARLKDLAGYPATPSETEEINQELMRLDAWLDYQAWEEELLRQRQDDACHEDQYS